MADDWTPFVYALEDETPSDEVDSHEAAEELVEQGTLTDETMCWNDGMDGWTEWAKCKGQFGFVQEAAADDEEEYDYEYYTVLQYQTDEGEPSDEIDTADVAALIEQGQFTDETMVWTEGMDDWYAWSQCKNQFGFDDEDGDADGVEEWVVGLDEAELKEQCEMAELELESWDEESMRDALRAMYGGGGEEDDEVTELIYEKPDGSYSDETPLAEAWELAEAGTIAPGTLCWAEGLDDWAPWSEAKHWFFDLDEEEEGEGEEGGGEEGAPSEGVPPVVEETEETKAARAGFEKMRPYQVKNECKKRRLPYDGKKEELIEALIVFDFGGGAKAAKEMAEEAKRKADEEAAAKKAEHHAKLMDAERQLKEEETAYLKKMRAEEAERQAKGKAGASPAEALQALGYKKKSVQLALKQAGGDQQRALELLQMSKKKLGAMTEAELTERVAVVMNDIDSYGTGSVGFRQLLSWVRRQQGGVRVTDEMLTQGMVLFNRYDVDGSGCLDREELREMLLEMEQDQLFANVIESFLEVEDDDDGPGEVRMLTLEDIARLKKIPSFNSDAQDMMLDYVEAELRTLNIPSIKGKQSWGVYEIQNVTTKKYEVGQENMTFDTSGRYRIMSKSAVRKGAARDSERVGQLNPGTIVKVLEEQQVDGQTRVRCRSGWLSIVAQDGTELMRKEECIVVHIADIKCLLKNFKCAPFTFDRSSLSNCPTLWLTSG